jgi:putative tryptophan/tyrosine transport system substrate-binding protein
MGGTRAADEVTGLRERTRRRNVLAILGTLALPWPRGVARAQLPRAKRIGWLSAAARTPEVEENLRTFLAALAKLGWVEGRNISIEYRWAAGDLAEMPAYAAELRALEVDVVACTSGLPDPSIEKATDPIPVVFLVSRDPVEAGLAASLNHPGGRFTGIIILVGALVAKQTELMHELRPPPGAIGVIVDPIARKEGYLSAAEDAARKLGRSLVHADVASETDFEPAVASLARDGSVGIVLPGSPLIVTRNDLIVAAATRRGIPTISSNIPSNRGVLSYGPSFPEMFSQFGTYVGKVLGGSMPAELPIEQPAKISLRVNLATAKAIGVTVPLLILARADEVIE